MTDVEYLNYLRSLNLPLVTEAGVPIGIRFADVPPVLQKAFDTFMFCAACPVIAGERCAWTQDWQRFLVRETNRHQEKMWKVAMTESQAGPSETDLANAPVLSNWIFARDSQFGGVTLLGTPFGHPLLHGPLISTSRLCGLDRDLFWARTLSRWYRLGETSSSEALTEAYPKKLKNVLSVVLTEFEVRGILKEAYEAARLI